MKTRNTGFSGVITMVWCGLLLAAPLAAGATDAVGHSTGGDIAISTPHVMTVSERRLLDSTLSHVSSLESYVVEIRTRGSEVETLAAENSLREAENLLISLMAQAGEVPMATITTMHSSGVSYGRIGYDLGVLTITDDTGAGHSTTAYHEGVAGSGDHVRKVVSVDYGAGDWDDHHYTNDGYGTSVSHGYSGYYGGSNHYNGMMGGMH